MRHPTTTLAARKPSVTLALAQAYNVILDEDGEAITDGRGDALLDEDGEQILDETGDALRDEDGDGLPLVGEAFARKVTVEMVCPSVTLELRRNA